MNWQQDWWKLAVLAAVVLGLVWWRQQGATPDNESELAEQLQLEQQVDQFLDEQGITLPEGSERANLQDVTGGVSTGVATRREVDDGVEYTVVAALDELSAGWYEAWLMRGEDYQSMGRLTYAKGGFVLDYDAETHDVEEVVQVSRESVMVEQPTAVVLEGDF